MWKYKIVVECAERGHEGWQTEGVDDSQEDVWNGVGIRKQMPAEIVLYVTLVLVSRCGMYC